MHFRFNSISQWTSLFWNLTSYFLPPKTALFLIPKKPLFYKTQVRDKVTDLFERASLPGVSEHQKERWGWFPVLCSGIITHFRVSKQCKYTYWYGSFEGFPLSSASFGLVIKWPLLFVIIRTLSWQAAKKSIEIQVENSKWIHHWTLSSPCLPGGWALCYLAAYWTFQRSLELIQVKVEAWGGKKTPVAWGCCGFFLDSDFTFSAHDQQTTYR